MKVKGMRVFSYIGGVYCAAMTMLALTHIDVTSFIWWAFYAPHAVAIVILGIINFETLLDLAFGITKSKELRSRIEDEAEKTMTEFKTLKVNTESGEEIYYVEQADHKEDK